MLIVAILDLLISSFIVAPLSISFWRGTFEYLNYYPGLFPIGWTLYISTILHVCLTLLREFLYEQKKPGFIVSIFTRIYIYIFGIICIAQWRSAFQLLDMYLTPVGMYTAAAVASVVFIAISGVGTLNGTPFVLSLDHKKKDVFVYPTMLQKVSTDNFWLFLLDCMFSVCIIGTLVVFVWRGFWCLLDHFLYPEDPTMSAWASLGVGYCVVALTFLLQPLMKYLAKELSGIARLAVVDTYLFFSFFGTVNLWRGVWNLLNVYLFPDNRPLSYALSHAIPFLILVMINSSNSILVRGVYIDCEEAGSQCVDFPCYYLRLFFQAQRKKKILKEAAKKSSERKEEEEGLVPVGRKATIISANADWKKTQNDSSPEMNQLLADIP